ncbi:type II secretion system protein [Helicobacter burdigaliensis]|uniref:type II secretion system protein n=1 Tax=Helicobacter burdigaliensis TaxID=2315334 RepID=UPI000EF71594|nr:prepilin-type N-terminal cleavage/methylation domain-containing protein [Helicobacter burdigaliensis]
MVLSTKRAFTMLELIFILVILGILAAIALPKISASRNDARLVALKSDVVMLKTALASYFLSQGKGDFESAIDLSATNWEITPFKITSKLTDKEGRACIEAVLLSEKEDKIALNDTEINFLKISTQAQGLENGDTCEKLNFTLNLNANTPQIIPLLSSSIAF